VWVCGKRFGSYSAIIPKVFDEMYRLIYPPPKLIILLCNNKAYPISITSNCADISLDFTLIEWHETFNSIDKHFHTVANVI
jgi:hypothetical protein